MGAHLEARLKQLPLAALARETGWQQRVAQKITPANLVTAALLLVTQPQLSLSVLASLLGLLGRHTVSKQAVAGRLTLAAARFLKEALGAALSVCLTAGQAATALPAAFGWPFLRILVQDSTTIKLTEKLAALYPGGANQHGRTPGVLRLQALFDLVTQRWVSFALSPYVRNDQKASPDILPHMRKNDLILRDLGYFAVWVLAQIAERGAFFVSRFYFRTAVFDLAGQPLNLLALLRQKGRVDQWVLLGQKEKLRVRLVAFRAPARVANERRRKARAHLQNRCQLSAAYLELQNWTIFLTNVPSEILTAREVMELYGQRWQIEIIFKGWKSHFQLEAVACTTTAALLEVAIYGKLLFITLTHPLTAPPCGAAAAGAEVRYYSRLRVSWLTCQGLLSVVLAQWGIDVGAGWARQLAYHGRYEKRKRRNMVQKFLALG